MINLSPKLKVLIAVATILVVAIIVAVVVVVVVQKNKGAKIQSISFVDATKQMYVGDEATLSIVIDPQDAKNKQVTFFTGDSSIVELVSVSENGVVVRALKIGETVVSVQSNANKKIVDSCTVVVRDNVGKEIVCAEKSNSIVGQQKVENVSLNPLSANLNKLVVKDFDENHLEFAKIEVENGSAKLIYKPLKEGVSQVVLTVMVETSSGEQIAHTHSILVSSTYASISELSFKARSNNYTTYVSDAQTGNDFVVSSGYDLYFDFFGDSSFEARLSAGNVEVLFDEDCIAVNVVHISDEGSRLKVVSKAGSWNKTTVRFSYAGQTKEITLHNINVSNLNFSVSLSNQMQVGSSYLLTLDETSKKLIDAGIAKLSLGVASTAGVSLEGLLIEANVAGNGKSIVFILSGQYWDPTVSDNLNKESSVVVNIEDISFVE